MFSRENRSRGTHVGPAITFTRYLRDNSDLKIGVNVLSDQHRSSFPRVDDFRHATTAEPEYLSECSVRDTPWDGHRADAEEIAHIYATDPGCHKLGVRISSCSLLLGFAWAPDRQDPNALTLKLRDAHFCRVRLCPICQWRRSLMWLARFHGALPKIFADYPSARFVFLTLTQKNVLVGELRQSLRDLNKAWARLSQLKPFGIVLGWIRTTEVTRAENGTAHPHFHVLLMVGSNYFSKSYVTHSQWAEMWRAALRVDYIPVVDVRAVKRKGSPNSDVSSAVRETFKYSVKPSDMKADPGWFLELTRQLRKLRFIASGGILKDILRIDEESESDLLLCRDSQPSDEKASVFFAWKTVPKRYRRARTEGLTFGPN